MPLEGMDIKLAGFNDQQAVLSHADYLGWTVLCTEPGFLQAPEIASHARHGKSVRKAARAARRPPWALAAGVALMVACVLAMILIWASRDAITAGLVKRIPVVVEEQIGEATYLEVKSTTRSLNDPAMRAIVDAITTRLLKGVKDSRYDFTFHIVEDDTINAYAIPGGHVVIHSALLKAAKRPEEIAGVLAHEIAHITLRHSLRNIVNTMSTRVMLKMLIGDFSGLKGASTDILELPYSRDFEREADDMGWQYLVDAGIDPRGMIDFFRTLQRQESGGAKMEGVMKIMSTHPSTAERITALESRAAALPGSARWEPILVPTAESPPVPDK